MVRKRVPATALGKGKNNETRKQCIKEVLVYVIGVIFGGSVFYLYFHTFSASHSNTTSALSTGLESFLQDQSTTSKGLSKSTNEPQIKWNDKGCQDWPRTPPPTIPATKKAPTGMAVTLARGTQHPQDTLDLLCSKLPTQLAYFFGPQGIDLLILVEITNIDFRGIVDCLELQQPANGVITKTWLNLDGSSLTTHLYTTKTKQVDVYLADYIMPLPQYIQQNMSILQEPMEGCKSTKDYIQGTRYYSDYFLQLKILSQYDYMIKMDLDIEFKEPLPYNMLYDMQQRGALLAHTGEYPKGLEPCGKGLRPFLRDFVKQFQTSEWAKGTNWKGFCSQGVLAFDRAVDRYYTNFVVLSRPFFQSQPVRDYGHMMNEYNPGFFKYRWTDQLFFHMAMGVFLGPDFQDWVVDYTDLRCKRFPNCWYVWVGTNRDPVAPLCRAGGYFYGGKNRRVFGPFHGQYFLEKAPLVDTPFVNHYQHDCPLNNDVPYAPADDYAKANKKT